MRPNKFNIFALGNVYVLSDTIVDEVQLDQNTGMQCFHDKITANLLAVYGELDSQ